MYYIPNENFIAHYGVKGMKWKKRKRRKFIEAENGKSYLQNLFDDDYIKNKTKSITDPVENKAIAKAVTRPFHQAYKNLADGMDAGTFTRYAINKEVTKARKEVKKNIEKVSAAQNRRAKQNRKDKDKKKKK